MILMISMHLERVAHGDHLCKSEVSPLQRELNGAQFLLSSYRTKRIMFIAKTNIKVRI